MIKYIENNEVKELSIQCALLPGQTEEKITRNELELMTRRDGIERSLYIEPPKTLREALADEIDAGTKTVEEANTVLRRQFESERKAAYSQKSDPLFFEYQAGDISKKEWEAARTAVKVGIIEPDYFVETKSSKAKKAK